MDNDFLIVVLKIAGAVVAGGLGILGVLTNVRNSDGRLNRWGISVLIGIILSSLLALLGFIFEGYKAKSDVASQLARTEKLLNELNRNRQPITQLEIVFWAKFPKEHPIVKSYFAKLSKAVNDNLEELLEVDFNKREVNLEITATGLQGEVISAEVKRDSPHWPDKEEEVLGKVALSFGFTHVFFRKVPIKPESFFPLHSVEPGYHDWMATEYSSDNPNRLGLNHEKNSLEIRGRTTYKKELWTTNGHITSIPDLFGAQIFLLPSQSQDLEIPERWAKYFDPKVKELSRQIELEWVSLRFSQGREIWIDGDKFNKTGFRSGYPVFSIILPTTEEEIFKLHSKG